MSLPCCAAKVITWSRPLRLARYIAQSALSMSSSLNVASAGHVAMPMLTDRGSPPAVVLVARIPARIRSATSRAPPSSVSRRMAANSSPP